MKRKLPDYCNQFKLTSFTTICSFLNKVLQFEDKIWSLHIRIRIDILRIENQMYLQQTFLNHHSSGMISFWYNIIAFVIFRSSLLCIKFQSNFGFIILLQCHLSLFFCMWFNIVVKSSDNVKLLDEMMIWLYVRDENKEEEIFRGRGWHVARAVGNFDVNHWNLHST